MATDARHVADARRWFRREGYDVIAEDGVMLVATPDHRATWDANWVMAGPATGPAAVCAALDRYFADGQQVVHVDCRTDPAVEAALVLAGYAAATTTIEMLARGPVVSLHPLPAIRLCAVDDANWPDLAAMVAIDHAEGRRTHHTDPAVGAGLLDAMRRKLGRCRFWLIETDGEAAAYGMTATCPNGLGLIESLFTLPAYRGRGLMSAFIVAAVAQLREAGCRAVFLDAHADGAPKRLYARLGFAPVALNRTWVRSAA